eukprot:Gb_23695 [translate_table: standard]
MGELFAVRSDKMVTALEEDGSLCWFSLEKKLVRPVIMGGEPVTTEPSMLIVDEDVRSILEEARLLSFFKKFSGHSESITNQFIESWKDGRVVVRGTEITINEALIADVSGLPNEGEVVYRAKMNQDQSQLHHSLSQEIRKEILKVWKGIACPKTQKKRVAEKGNRQPKLSANLAKCSRSSTRLQKKTEGKSDLLDITESLEEDRKSEDPESLEGRSSPPKVTTATPSVKSEKSPVDSLSLSEELRYHLQVLNVLGGSLTSTYACINLLKLEITNYLKEVLKNMKEMKDTKE